MEMIVQSGKTVASRINSWKDWQLNLKLEGGYFLKLRQADANYKYVDIEQLEILLLQNTAFNF